MIYADNAATTKLCLEAYEAMKPYLVTNTAMYPSRIHLLIGKDGLKNARETVALCIGALPEEIYFTAGGLKVTTKQSSPLSFR